MQKLRIVSAVAAITLATQAFAQDGLNYNYIEADYLSTKYDDDGALGIDVDGDGFGVQGAVAFAPKLHGYVEYTNQDFDFDIGIKTWEVGLGLNWAMAPNVDFIGRVGYADADAEIVDDNGFALQAGVRALLAERFELEGIVHYTDLSDFGDNTTFRATGRYSFNDAFSLSAGAELDSDTTIWLVGARFSFPKK